MNVFSLLARGATRPPRWRRTQRKGIVGVLLTGALVAMGLVAVGPAAAVTAVEATWTHLSPATSPPALVYASMAYDPTSQKLVLFGGEDASRTSYAQTWTYDGSTWTDVSPATSPPARTEATMVYDAAISKMVLFGGVDNYTYRNDTWTYDVSSNTWTQVSQASPPPVRASASMAYDGSRGNVILFGGYDEATWLGDTWTFDGTTWTEESVTGPQARFGATMVFDPDIGKLVLFGGYGDYAALSDTWTYDGTTWTDVSPSTSPPPRRIATMAYDSALHQVVLFGGFSDPINNDLSDTWTYDGSTWTQQFPATSPGLYEAAVMAYDEASGQVILFGGFGGGMGGTFRSDTWAYAVPTVFAPDAPAAPDVVPGNGQVVVSWSAPTSDGGSPITEYTVAYTPTGGGTELTQTVTAPTTTTTIVGLTNGTSYDFKVRARNDIGFGEYSLSTSATPSTVPNAPAMPNLVPGNMQVQVSWSEPLTGGSTITGYTVAYRVSGAKGNKWSTVTTTDTSTTVSGLTNSVQYVFKVLATNANGDGPYSPERAGMPYAANAPGVPTDVAAVAQPSADGRSIDVVLTWTDNGTNPATDHEVTVYAYRAGNKGAPTYRVVDLVRTSSGSSTANLSGLSLHKAYAFSVSAGNADGWSVPSIPSNSVGG